MCHIYLDLLHTEKLWSAGQTVHVLSPHPQPPCLCTFDVLKWNNEMTFVQIYMFSYWQCTFPPRLLVQSSTSWCCSVGEGTSWADWIWGKKTLSTLFYSHEFSARWSLIYNRHWLILWNKRKQRRECWGKKWKRLQTMWKSPQWQKPWSNWWNLTVLISVLIESDKVANGFSVENRFSHASNTDAHARCKETSKMVVLTLKFWNPTPGLTKIFFV